MDQTLIQRIIEAALLAAHQPLNLTQLSALFPEDAPAPSGAIEQALQQLREDCATRGVELVEVASGYRYQVRADLQPWVARLWTERQTRYSRATLETLALIAYRQPITRGEIEQIRGVAVNSNLIKALEEREWIRVIGHRDVPGKPELLGTTRSFLDYFGLKSLDQLPPLAALREVPELDPQLPLDDAPMPAMLGTDEASGVTDLGPDAIDPRAFGQAHGGHEDDDLVMATSVHLDDDAIDAGSDELGSTELGSIHQSTIEIDAIDPGILEQNTIEPDVIEPDVIELDSTETHSNRSTDADARANP